MRWFRLAVCSVWILPLFAADDLPPGPGSAVAAKTCTVCHGVDNIRQKRLSRDDWADVVDEMIDRGAKLTDREKETVLSYLAESLGPNSKLWVNSAPLAEWKAVAGLTVPEAKAVIEYRKQNGDFHQIGDLLNVPGVDPRKIEAKKDVFAF
jgi:competence ComEA-like helix-hairpin-helix protein